MNDGHPRMVEFQCRGAAGCSAAKRRKPRGDFEGKTQGDFYI